MAVIFVVAQNVDDGAGAVREMVFGPHEAVEANVYVTSQYHHIRGGLWDGERPKFQMEVAENVNIQNLHSSLLIVLTR